MLHHDGGERRYTDEEFVLVLRRAREIEGRGGTDAEPPSAPWADGLTLAEMFEIGRQAGIDPEAVAEAAATVGAARPGALDAVLGGTVKLLVESSFDRTLSEEDVGRVVDAARGVLGSQGEATQVPGGVEWTSSGRETRLHVRVDSGGGGTRIRMEVTRVATVVLSYWTPTAVSVVVAAVVLGATGPHPTGVLALVMAGASAVGLAIGRVMFAAASRAWDQRTRRLLAAVTRVVRESSDHAR